MLTWCEIAMKITKEQIRKAREALGFSQSEFAVKLGLTGSTVSLMERGQTTPINLDEVDEASTEDAKWEFAAWQALL